MERHFAVSNLLVGADPELFFAHKSGAYASIIGKIGGTKSMPKPIGNNCFIQEDNVAAEFNIPPAATADKFVESIKYNLSYLESRAKELGLKLAITASAEFNSTELQNPAAWEFGCEPDYNAWLLDMNPKPKGVDPNLRSAGGHVHLATEDDPIQTIRAMDLHIGAQLIVVDKDTKRRQLYGKAGAFRQKPYGVEYRTPSNFWITDEKWMRWVFDQCVKVKDWVAKGNVITGNTKVAEWLQDAINNSDVEKLNKVNHFYGLSAINQ